MLADRGGVGDARADVARGLGLERLELVGRRTLEREADEANTQTPDIVFLRRTVKLDGEDVLVQVREFGEERLLVDALLVDGRPVYVQVGSSCRDTHIIYNVIAGNQGKRHEADGDRFLAQIQ